MALISPLALLCAVLRGHTRGVVSAAFSEWRGLLFTAGLDSSIHVWSALSETIIATLRAHTAPLVEIVDMTGAPYVASADASGVVHLWDVRSTVPLHQLSAHEGKALCVAWDGAERVASGGADAQLRVSSLALPA